MAETTSRREFLTHAIAGVTLAALAEDVLASQQPASTTGLPTRRLGQTGQQVSIVCLGGWHIGAVKDPAEAVRIMQAALDEGVTFFDNCWDYHDGGAEEVMGRALADGRRNKVFLMTKNCERDHAGSAEQRHERTHFVGGPVYGTRCSTIVLVDAAGRATFAERSFDAAGYRVGDVRETFEIQRED